MGFESGEVLDRCRRFRSRDDQSSYLGLDSDDSSEVVLEPFVSDSRSLSRCSTAVKSSVSMAAVGSKWRRHMANTDQILAKSGNSGSVPDWGNAG